MTCKYWPVIIILAGLLFSSCDQQSKTIRTNDPTKKKLKLAPPGFNADSAYSFVEKQVSFGPRVAGTEAHAACAKWLTEKLSAYSDTVIVQNFKARTYDKVTRNGKNIIASFKPKEQKRVLLMSHWDSRPFADHDPDETLHQTPIDGANDGASGVGVLLEIARQMAILPPDVGVDIVLFDLEDWGPPTQLEIYEDEYWGLGSQYWSKSPHVLGYYASFGILLDMVGASNPTFMKEYFSRQYAKYFVDLVWATADDMGYGQYFIDQNGSAINDDHVFVNKFAKIPSIDIIHLDPKSTNKSFYEHWHTSKDNLDQIDKRSLMVVGEVVMAVVYNE